MKNSNQVTKKFGFTIIELLVVIVIIGILTAIMIVSYIGITGKAVGSTLQSDLTNAKGDILVYQAEKGVYPTNVNDCPTPSSNSNLCFKYSSGNSYYWYDVDNNTSPKTFTLKFKNGNTYYKITNDASPIAFTTPLTCPTGFIPVPGSTTYGTSDFCVMKYEAKNAGSSVPVSTATGAPWVSISQTTAATNSANVVGCTGCHLITEAEWLTIAQNVLSVASNWSGGTVGTGCIFRGNVGALDACGYNGADPESGTGRNAKASLTLTNGEVIWDLAGNVWEWTSGTSTTGQPGITGEGAYAWKEWPNATAAGTLSPNVFPSGTGISGANTWTSSNGIGQLYSYAGEAGLRGFLRGGYWITGSGAGVLSLSLSVGPGITYAFVGFRVSR